MQIFNLPGVYCFWHKASNKIYVGSTQNLNIRLNQHFKSSHNLMLKRAIIKYGLKAFHISQIETGSHAEALALEQMCLDYIFAKNLPKYNIANIVGGGCVGSKENHTNLCLQGQNKAEHKKLCEISGGSKAIVRYAIDLTTNKIYKFESSIDAEKQTGVLFRNISVACKTEKTKSGNDTRWIFALSIKNLLTRFNSLTNNEKQGQNKYKFVLFDGLDFSKVFNNTCETKISQGNLSSSLQGKSYQTIKGYIVLITELNGALVSDPIAQYKERFSHVKLTKNAKQLLITANNSGLLKK